MRFTFTSVKLFLPLTLVGLVIQNKPNNKTQERLSQLIEKLDKDAFSPVRFVKPMNDGFKNSGVINKYENVSFISIFDKIQQIFINRN
jgi:hypothetical protein